MSEKRIVLKIKEPKKYVRFGTCDNCGAVIAVIGTRWEIEDYLRIKCLYCNMDKTVPLGFLHKANGLYTKRKLRKVEGNESKSKY